MNPIPIVIKPGTVAERKHHIEALAGWLTHDPNAVKWAADMRAGGAPHIHDLNRSSLFLVHRVLIPFMKSLEMDLSDETDENAHGNVCSQRISEFDEPNEHGEMATLGAVVRVTLPFERARTLFLMQIERTPRCPLGCAWMSYTDRAIRVRPTPAFGGTTQTYVIPHAYDCVAQFHHDPNVVDYVLRMTTTVMPSWLKALYPKEYAQFVSEQDLVTVPTA